MPQKLTVLSAAVAGEGGSISVYAIDESGAQFHFKLEWSISHQMNYTTRLVVNGEPIERASQAEDTWAELLDASGDELAMGAARCLRLPRHRIGRDWNKGPTDEDVRALLKTGDRTQALKLYRTIHPELCLKDAFRAVKALS